MKHILPIVVTVHTTYKYTKYTNVVNVRLYDQEDGSETLLLNDFNEFAEQVCGAFNPCTIPQNARMFCTVSTEEVEITDVVSIELNRLFI